MNLVFVNHMHPETPHVSGMRSWYFARELVKRGHRVVQICEWRQGTEPAPAPAQLAQRLQAHDWAEPLLLAVVPQRRRLLEQIRSPRTPAILRKALVTWSYLRHSGMFTDFSQAVQAYLPVLSQEFQPRIAWGVFGNTDCWLIAQRQARLAGCPWVADMKDSWEVFMRRPLRALIARRFQDMSASTANADFNAQVLRRWFPGQPVIVYSGVDRCFFDAAPEPLEPGVFRLTLTGGVYDSGSLKRFVSALADWLESETGPRRNGRLRAEIVYAGGDHARVERALRPLQGSVKIDIRGYLPLTELAALCRSATVNAYIWNPKTFHHKLLELLSCGRPVIAFPGETEESRALADACGGEFHCPTSEDALIDTLSCIDGGVGARSSANPVTDAFTWGSQASVLEQVLGQPRRREGV